MESLGEGGRHGRGRGTVRDGAWCGERSLSFARARSCLSQTDDGGTEVGYALTAVTRSPACPVFVPHIRRVRTSNLTQLALLGVVEPWAVRRLPLTAGHCTRDPQDCARAAVRWLRQRFRCTRSLCVVTAPRLVRPYAAFLTTCGVVLLRRIESTVTSSRATGQLLLRRLRARYEFHGIRQLADSGSRSSSPARVARRRVTTCAHHHFLYTGVGF